MLSTAQHLLVLEWEQTTVRLDSGSAQHQGGSPYRARHPDVVLAFVPVLHDLQISNMAENLATFWENNQQRLPTFTALFLHFCILNPFSASVERVFSFLKHYMDETAYNSLEDYTLLKVMRLFNQES